MMYFGVPGSLLYRLTYAVLVTAREVTRNGFAAAPVAESEGK